MEYTTLGDSGLSVSRIGIGCGRFGLGDPAKLGPTESAALVDRAIDLGINLFDTANVYSSGQSEELLGAALEGYDREFPVVATKVYFETDPDDPNAAGLSRKAIDHAIDASLERLGLETVDLYQIHRWDAQTPIEETLRTLDDLVRRGRVRYIGASSMDAHQFATAQAVSERLGLERFISMQNHYNLVYREEEREMLPYCRTSGVGTLPWSPLARGFLARPSSAIDATPRGERLVDSDRLTVYRSGGGDEVARRVGELADTYDASMAQIAIAWLLHQEGVTAPIVGMSAIEHLEEAVAALDISLDHADLEYLEEPYQPKPITGHD